ncbi:MAG: TetR/AcrR family transcriptional regulator, partial [Mesorhizobium sp.]
PTDDEVLQSATHGVRTFLRALAKRQPAADAQKHSALAGA